MNNAILKYLIRLLLAIAVLAACFQLVDAEQVAAVLRQAPAWSFLAAFSTNIAGSIIIPAAVTWYALQISSIRISFWQLLCINFAIRFYVLVMPRALAMGMRWYRYKKAGTGHEALALMVFERVVQFLVLIIASTAFIGFDLEKLGANGTLLLVFTGFLSILILLVFFLFLFNAAAVLFDHLLMRHSRYFPVFIHRHLDKLWTAVTAFHKLPSSAIIRIIFLSVTSYVLFILSAYVLALGMGIKLSFFALAWIRSLTFLLTMIPLTVGGIGVREAGFITFLALYGVPKELALAFSLGLLVIQLAIGLIGALNEGWNFFIRSRQQRA